MRVRGAVAIVVMALAALTVVPPHVAHAARGMEVGLADDGVFLYRAYYKRWKALKQARALGVTRLRVSLPWAGALGRHQALKKKELKHPRYYLHRWDNLIDAAADAGIRVQLTITGSAPAFATSNHKIGEKRPNAGKFGKFVRAIAEHFKGRVNRYSLWNEPNYISWLEPMGSSPKIYRKLYIAGYGAIKDVDPKATVLMGETAPHAAKDRSIGPLDFLRRVACVTESFKRDKKCAKAAPAPGGRLKTDGYAQHPYEFLHSPSTRWAGPNDATVATLDRLISELDKLTRAKALTAPHHASTPLYLTEFGYFRRGRRKISESRHAHYLRDGFAIALRNRRVKQMLQWTLIEPPRKYPGSFFDTAIVRKNGKPYKPYNWLKSWAKGEKKNHAIKWPPKRIKLPPERPSSDTPRAR